MSLTRTNSQLLLSLVHGARFVIYAGFALMMWVELVNWRPSPPVPGGPIVMQLRLSILQILITLVTMFRGFLAWKIGNYRNRIIGLSAGLDIFELLLIMWILAVMSTNIVFYNLLPFLILYPAISFLSFISFILSIIVINEIKKNQEK